MSVPAIELSGLTRRFSPGADPAVDSLSLSVAPGETLTLFGPSGSGKTTVLRLIAGFDRPDAGRIRIAGRTVSEPGLHVAPEERRVGFVFQDYALFPHLTVAGNILFGLRSMPRSARAARLREVVELTRLEGLEERFPHELSGGQQQRVAVARALAPDNPVVLLDEPLSNLDASLRSSLRAELSRILKASGKTVLLVTHDREEAFEMSDRIGVLAAGRLEQVGTPETVHARPATIEVARLVCEASFLRGVREEGALATEIGRLPIPGNGAGPPSSERLVAVVRDESVRLVRDDAGPGVVEKRVFRGPGHLYHVRLPSGASLRCLRETPDFLVGERVRVELDPETVVILTAEGKP